jgi:hypothetical protein
VTSDLVAVENRLWAAADQLWANTGLKPSEFSTPVLGLIFLRYADTRFAEADAALAARGIAPRDREATDYQAEGVLYLPEDARFAYLQSLTEGADLGRHITRAMTLVEDHNPELRGVLPRGYTLLPNATLVELLRLLAPLDLQGDAFGKVYEYFLGNFALKEGQKGGVFYTPTSIVRLIVEVIQPFHGRIFDPACGFGGMFVQSAEFVRRHRRNATTELSGLEAYYAMPNIARRLLEAFLAFRMPDKPGGLFRKLDCLDYDAAKKTLIQRFLDTYSHADQVVEPGHDPSALSETPVILQEVLALVRTCDPQHYDRMARLIAPDTSEQAAIT